ncbi:XrtA-associated tyrosine autokinase [Candidatus Methylomicrobium oryzae]|uniref:XrtA-associated tyrosine autokinase n=1 Tax=Candidatus Methylomicrobium oryzae TaxID=2802053 RepID=UPI0019209FD2|nr:AAA family ATPase [Methylomicrobium sp. RS1]
MNTIERALHKAENENQIAANPTALPEDIKSQLDKGKEELLSTPMSTKNRIDATENGNLLNKERIENIDWDKLAGMGFVTPSINTDQKSIEEYRNIKRPLINNALGSGSEGIQRSNLILVTSSVPGEGKTFSAINLALSIANERDTKVLLIDADVARPSISKTLGIKSSPGLIEYLEKNDIEFSDIILKTNMPGLSVVPAGKQHRHSTELLTSNKMVRLAQELSTRYPDRIVIFDSPPLLAATQGAALAGLVGQVVLVVEAENTPQAMVMSSVNKLEFCDVVLLLLNKTQVYMETGYYGYDGYGTYGN